MHSLLLETCSIPRGRRLQCDFKNCGMISALVFEAVMSCIAAAALQSAIMMCIANLVLSITLGIN